MSDQAETFTVTYSIDGLRSGLTRKLSEFKALIQDIEEDERIDDGHLEALKESLNELICTSNGFNCVSVKEVEGFSDMSDLYLEPFNDEEDDE